MKNSPRSAPRNKSGSTGRPSFGKSAAPFGKSADKRSEPRKAGSGGFAKKPAFGKTYSERTEPRREGSFDKRPRRTERAGDSERTEGFSKPASRFGKSAAPASTESRSYSKRADARKTAGSFDKPRRFDRDDKPASRFGKTYGEKAEPRREGSFDKRPKRFERDDKPERSEGFSKPASRFGKKPAFGKGAPSKGRDFHAKSERKPTRTVVSDSGKIMPKRESLNRQGVLLWGIHAVREAWLNPERKCYRLWGTTSGLASLDEAIEEAKAQNLSRPDPILAEKAEIEHFLPHSTVHQGVALEVEPLPEMSLDDLLAQDPSPEIVIVLDQVTDPHNVGAILRSAAAFGAKAIIVTERNAPNTTGIMAKTASGAVEHVPLIPVVNIARTLETLKNENYWCVGLAEEGKTDMAGCALSKGRVALVLGAEGEGLRRLTREHCDELARLPTQGRIGSLNVSNAAAVALYEVCRQRG